MDWRKTYPVVAAVSAASFETVCAWCDSLPDPQTDVEKTVHRRLHARRATMIREQVREQAPHIADRFNGILDMMEKAGIKPPMARM